MSRRILVVDDSDFARRVLCKSLTSIFTEEFLDVIEAGDGDQALDILREDPPDLMFLDLTMPVVD